MAKIMVVEDDSILNRVFCDFLDFMGHEFDSTESVSDFAEKLHDSETWDLVITDFCLDTHTCHRVVELATDQGVPVMVFTGHDVDDIKRDLPIGTPTFCKSIASRVNWMEKVIGEQLEE